MTSRLFLRDEVILYGYHWEWRWYEELWAWLICLALKPRVLHVYYAAGQI